jgi:putative transposase
LIFLYNGLARSLRALRSIEIGKAKRTGHAVYRLNYHFVWIPKYRRAVLKGAVAERAKELFQEIAEQYEMEMDTLEVMEDHVHIFLSAPPRYAPA